MGLGLISKKIGLISPAIAYIGDIAIVVMMCLSTADVVGRYIFNTPITGVFEITEFLMLILVFSYLGFTQSSDAHISIDILVPHLPKKVQVTIERFNHLICLIMMALIAWKGAMNAFELKKTGDASTLLKIPIYPFAIFLALGCTVLCLEYIRNLIKLFWKETEEVK